MSRRIMYICTECADGYPEGCGHYDRSDLRSMPDGRWLCEACFDDTSQIDRGNSDEDKYLDWGDLPAPPEYGPAKSSSDWSVEDDCMALLEAIDHTLSVHGHVDADTDLHDRLRRTIALSSQHGNCK